MNSVAGAHFRAENPQVVYVFAAIRAEAGDHGTARAFSARPPSAWIWPPEGLREFRSHAFSSPCDLAERAANAHRLIDRGPGASAQAAQCHAPRAGCVLYWSPAGTARALRHSDFISQVAIAANPGAIEPCRVEELAGLHVESDGHGIFVAYGIGSGPAALAAAEVDGRALVRYVHSAMIVIAAMITVAILIVLSRGERSERDQTQHPNPKKRSALCPRLLQDTSQESDGLIPLTAR